MKDPFEDQGKFSSGYFSEPPRPQSPPPAPRRDPAPPPPASVPSFRNRRGQRSIHQAHRQPHHLRRQSTHRAIAIACGVIAISVSAPPDRPHILSAPPRPRSSKPRQTRRQLNHRYSRAGRPKTARSSAIPSASIPDTPSAHGCLSTAAPRAAPLKSHRREFAGRVRQHMWHRHFAADRCNVHDRPGPALEHLRQYSQGTVNTGEKFRSITS